jgi:hypothetical protein
MGWRPRSKTPRAPREGAEGVGPRAPVEAYGYGAARVTLDVLITRWGLDWLEGAGGCPLER